MRLCHDLCCSICDVPSQYTYALLSVFRDVFKQAFQIIHQSIIHALMGVAILRDHLVFWKLLNMQREGGVRGSSCSAVRQHHCRTLSSNGKACLIPAMLNICRFNP